MNTRQISFAIEGMYCAQCAVNIERALVQRDGIVSALVNYATERATATYDPTRITAAAMVEAVTVAGYRIPRRTETFHVSDLLYATSAATVQRVLSRIRGVVQVSADVGSGSVRVEGIGGDMNRPEIAQSLVRLSLHDSASPVANAGADFIMRMLLVAGIAFALIWGALSHLGTLTVARELPSPILLGALAAFALFAVGWPFYRRALAALLQGELDGSVWIALFAMLSFFCGAVVALFSLISRGEGWSAWSGFIAATVLTASWFVARGVSLWRAATSRQAEAVTMSAVTQGFASIRIEWRRRLLPPLVGVSGALALIGLYLGIISVAQGPQHALEQLAQDQLWVGLVALGFGTQVGLYAYLRLVVQALKLAGATALTGVGTGTSTLGMIACCAHHVTDFAPLGALAGATGLSGAVTFLSEWKIPLILFGLIVNAVGIAVTLRTIQKTRVHLHAMEQDTPTQAATATVCH